MYSRLRRKLVRSQNALTDWWRANTLPLRGNVHFSQFNLPTSQERQKRLLVLAHYSSADAVSEYVYHYIAAMRSAGCDVMLVSTAPALSPAEVKRLSEVVVALVVRRNIGYDFGSWKTAVSLYPGMRQDYDCVIFSNDSIYGPFVGMSPLLQAMDVRQFDLWGLTSSLERQYHIQSYFWGMSAAALKGDFFDFFWNDHYRFYSRRQAVIDRYEIKLATMARELFGLRVGAAFEVERIWELARASDNPLQKAWAQRALDKVNPTQHLCQELLENHAFPFVKRELLERDPFGLGARSEIASLLKGRAPQVWKLVELHLDRSESE